MNELEARGQKWFWLSLLALIAPNVWNLIRVILHLAKFQNWDELPHVYQFELTQNIVTIGLIVGIFILIYRGFNWSKWVLVGFLLLAIAVHMYSAYIGLESFDKYPVRAEAMLLNQVKAITFILVPILVLIFSPAAKAFITYQKQLKMEKVSQLDQQLNQIGSDE